MLVENNRWYLVYSTYIWAPFGMTPLEFRRDFWHHKKLKTLRYRVALSAVIVRLAVFGTIPACDGQMDGQTHEDNIYNIYRAKIASRGKNLKGNGFVDGKNVTTNKHMK